MGGDVTGVPIFRRCWSFPNWEQWCLTCYMGKAFNFLFWSKQEGLPAHSTSCHYRLGRAFCEGYVQTGRLVLQCYKVIDTVGAPIKAANTPNLLAVAEKLFGGVDHNKKLMIDRAQHCVQAAIDYFNGQLSSTLQHPLEAFKAARYFSPQKVHEIQPTASSIDCLKAFPFFDSKDLEGLKGELPTYLAKPANMDSSIDPMHWWRLNASV